MIEIGSLIVTAFLVYLAVVMAIGVYSYSYTSDLSDYILGGRTLGRWVTALSAQASDMSGWLLMGLPGMAYLSGLKSLWLATGLFIGTYLNWKFLAAPLRRATAELNDSLTLPDYLEHRFEDDSGVLRLTTAIIILVFFTIYTSSQLVAGAKLFVTIFGISYLKALVAGGVVILVYTFVGGFIAVSWTDALQGILMFIALFSVALYGVYNLGGLNQTLSRIGSNNIHLLNPLTESSGTSIGLIGIISLLGWGLGYFGQPHILARFMAIESPSLIGTARKIAISWVAVCLIGGIASGLLGVVLVDATLTGAASERIFILLTSELFHPALAGVFLAAILAAIMSTADSQLLVASSAVAEDLYKGFFRKEASDKELLNVGRISVMVLAVIAMFIGNDPESRVLNLVGYAWAGLGASFGPVLILSLWGQGFGKYSALSGMVVGGITVIVWKQLQGGIFELYEIIPAFVLSFLSILLVDKLRESFVSN